MKHIKADKLSDISGAQNSVLALGNFDGFHRGHQAVVGRAAVMGQTMGVPFGVLTFCPHPRSFFRPDDPPFLLSPGAERAYLLSRFGADLLVELPFNRVLAKTPAQDFLSDILLGQLAPHGVIVGYDYRFGQERAGDTALLKSVLEEAGVLVEIVEPVPVGVEGAAGAVYSSTLVRQALHEGRPRSAAALLGHWWSVTGMVAKGDQRGRTIGFPTANISLGEAIRPAFGVYAVRVILPDGSVVDGVANVGRRPTFETSEERIEAHLFDFEGDLYDQTLRVEFVGFLRNEQRFDGLPALTAQISRDVGLAKSILADPENQRERLLPPHFGDNGQ